MGRKVSVQQPSEWHLNASTTGNPSVTKPGISGKRHMVTGIVASYTGAGGEGTLTMSDGSTFLSVTVHENMELEFPNPLAMGVGQDVTVSLGQSGSATGKVNVYGYTAHDPATYRALESTT